MFSRFCVAVVGLFAWALIASGSSGRAVEVAAQTSGVTIIGSVVDASYRTRLASWKGSLSLVRRSPAWRLRQAYIRRTAGA